MVMGICRCVFSDARSVVGVVDLGFVVPDGCSSEAAGMQGPGMESLGLVP